MKEKAVVLKDELGSIAYALQKSGYEIVALYEKDSKTATICRQNKITAARGCLRESGKIILCLSNQDLLELIRIKDQGDESTAENLAERLDQILINLEK